MNIKKSIDLCLASKGMTNTELANKLEVSKQALSYMKARRHHKTENLEKLAKIFNMPVSKFIKLGE